MQAHRHSRVEQFAIEGEDVVLLSELFKASILGSSWLGEKERKMADFTTKILTDRYADRPVLRVDLNENGKADASEPILVKKNEAGWEPVDTLTASVDRDRTASDYALWSDREISKGVFFPKVVREKDGLPQPDELTGLDCRYQVGMSFGADQMFVGAEIVKTDQAAPLYHEKTYPMGMRFRAVGTPDSFPEVREDDSLWFVSR
ncbi:MAG: hypothetical protein HY319_29150 [Armatimonadetes bacterium]|nr:hypothetical protein [Armatimonadota bacterium]